MNHKDTFDLNNGMVAWPKDANTSLSEYTHETYSAGSKKDPQAVKALNRSLEPIKLNNIVTEVAPLKPIKCPPGPLTEESLVDAVIAIEDHKALKGEKNFWEVTIPSKPSESMPTTRCMGIIKMTREFIDTAACQAFLGKMESCRFGQGDPYSDIFDVIIEHPGLPPVQEGDRIPTLYFDKSFDGQFRVSEKAGKPTLFAITGLKGE